MHYLQVLAPCTLAVGIGLFSGVTGASAATDLYGNTLYKAQHGAPDGWPGCLPEKITVIDKATGNPVMDEASGKPLQVDKFPKWGFPELENYPGSVEHWRTFRMKYQPAINVFNQKSLVRNWVLSEALTEGIEEFAEPIVYVPMYGIPRWTGKYREPVKVFRLKRDGGNAIRLKVGTLKVNMYALRLIAAQPEVITEDGYKNQLPPKVILTVSINAGENGARQSWTRNHLAADEFYAVGEWYFHALDDRDWTVEIRMDPESETDLMVYNVDLHDALAETPAGPFKKGCSYYPTAAREQLQESEARQGNAWKGDLLTGAPRRARDAYLWNAVAPEFVNLTAPHFPMGYFQSPEPAKLSPDEKNKIGTWKLAFDKEKRTFGWPMVNETLGLTYTREDYLAARPLPDPYPYKDRGWGVYLADKSYLSPIIDALKPAHEDTLWKIASSHQWAYADKASKLTMQYYRYNDLNAARDAALLVCRQAYDAPAYITYYKRTARFVRRHPNSNRAGFRKEFNAYLSPRILAVAYNYDMLFDFIKGNEELTQAVSAFVPWIRNNRDLLAFLDQRLLGLSMREHLRYRNSGGGDFDKVLPLAILIDNLSVSDPLMRYLFSDTWVYPLPLSGIQDYIVTTQTRDGTKTIGSFFYTASGSEFSESVALSRQYVKNGGDKQYALSDPKRFPQAIAGYYFPLEARVAGLWPIGVGDVGGLMAYGQKAWMNFGDQVRMGWEQTRDPKFAYLLLHYFGRQEESASDWAAIERAAKNRRDPFMENRSRVLSTWAGILEDGTDHDDFRFRRAATVRVGVGWGHSHRDTLDLQVFALGCQMTPDGGMRPGYGSPSCQSSRNHNVVEIDGQNWEGHAWIDSLSDMAGSRTLSATGIPTPNLKDVSHIRRRVALLDVDPGAPTTRVIRTDSGNKYGREVILPKGYVFDVFRVSGGRQHSFSFHGAPGLEFAVNAEKTAPVPAYDPATSLPDGEAAYMKDYIITDRKFAGDAPDNLVAHWTLGREPFEFEAKRGGEVRKFRAGAPEPIMMGDQYDPASPRKHIRLHMPGTPASRVLWGSWVSAPYTHSGSGFGPGQQFVTLHAIRRSADNQDSIFASIIETYAGDQPAVLKATRLAVTPAAGGALAPVAMEVQAADQQTDILFDNTTAAANVSFADSRGRPYTVAGRYAYCSVDANGLRQASLSGGTHFMADGLVEIATPAADYACRITAIDHLEKTIVVDADLPGALIGKSFWNVGNPEHGTSLEVTRIAGRNVTYRKGLEIVSTRVMEIQQDRNIVRGKLASISMGLPEDNGMKPGMTAGFWATNDEMKEWWKCAYQGGSRDDGYTYKLEGRPITEQDFPVQGSFRVFELGASDTMALATHVSIKRHALPGILEVEANAAAEIRLAGPDVSGVRWSADRVKWEPLEVKKERDMLAFSLTEAMLGAGRLYLRLER